MSRQIVSLSLNKKTLGALDQISQKEDRSRSAVVRDLIRHYLIERTQPVEGNSKATLKVYLVPRKRYKREYMYKRIRKSTF